MGAKGGGRSSVERVDETRQKEKDERGARRKDQQPAVRSSPLVSSPPAKPMSYADNGKSIRALAATDHWLGNSLSRLTFGYFAGVEIY